MKVIPIKSKREKVVITLIHGTFAKDNEWTKIDSNLSKNLLKKIGDIVRIEQFNWSGRNSIYDREMAAKELCAFLNNQRKETGRIKQFIIAHSHGGSVVCLALNNTQALNTRPNGVVFLGTPFIHARISQDWHHIADITTISLACCFIFILNILLFKLSSIVSNVTISSLISIIPLIIFGMVADRIPKISNFLFPEKKLKAIADSISTPRLPRGNYLFIRMTGDEAFSLLSTTQFFSWFVTKYLTLMSKMYTAPIVGKYTRRSIFLVIVAYSLVLSIGYFGFYSDVSPDFWLYFSIHEWNLEDIWLEQHLFFRIGNVLVLSLLSFMVTWLIFCIVSSLTHFSYGRFAFFTTLFHSLAVEPVPQERHELLHIPWDESGETKGLSHSLTYETRDCINHISNWISRLNI